MGLNYVRRARREELDSPNDFITVVLGETDLAFAIHDQHLIFDFENAILDKVEETFKNLDFDK